MRKTLFGDSLSDGRKPALTAGTTISGAISKANAFAIAGGTRIFTSQ
jgi:hypothetical protein